MRRAECCIPEDRRRIPTDHTIGTGAGAAVGGLAGGLIGAAAGPAGLVIGAGMGAIAGGLAGCGLSGALNPEEEDQYWRHSYRGRSYIRPGGRYEEYEPAYRYGWESAATHAPQGRTFDALEPDLQKEWDSHRGGTPLDWMQARPAAREAWERVESRIKRREHGGGRFV